VDRRVDIDRLVPTVFSERERSELALLDAIGQRRRFFELWTLKEAYIKAVGMGLALPLRAITFGLSAGSQPSITFEPSVSDDSTRWWLDVRAQRTTHVMGVALGAPASTVCFEELDPTE